MYSPVFAFETEVRIPLLNQRVFTFAQFNRYVNPPRPNAVRLWFLKRFLELSGVKRPSRACVIVWVGAAGWGVAISPHQPHPSDVCGAVHAFGGSCGFHGRKEDADDVGFAQHWGWCW